MSSCFSGQVEELSVRGKIAVEQKKVLIDYNVAQGNVNINDAEDEYLQLSAQIVSFTHVHLNIFFHF
jgi:hypothetical protein